jgi:hypothetical protein
MKLVLKPSTQAVSAACKGLIGICALIWMSATMADPAKEPSPGVEPAYEEFMLRGQSTYINQHKPAFSSALPDGPNSLTKIAESSYTFTNTLFFGWRPQADLELYFVPEMNTGIAFSALQGMGGFTNGEVTRSAGSKPSFYRQKLFLRKTWNEGDLSEVVEADTDQLKGLVSRNRWVMTAGNFSNLDIFDDNAYAKDPRTQFMNWGNMTYAAYDYAADARGYGWGLALEWYKENWAMRLSRMTGPKLPNGLPVDFQIAKHFGDQFEIERTHYLMNQLGKARVIVWHDRANLANFNDALAYGLANPSQSNHQWIVDVRNGEKDKYGLGFNLEQSINSNLGFFARAMRSDGKTETYAFTEVDNSLSLGAVMNGSSWGRALDAVGLSYMQNGLSKERQNYLRAGGISFFIGEGNLVYKPETILEAYYSVGLSQKTAVTFDVQSIQNPAYNALRGPVLVTGFRLHTEF